MGAPIPELRRLVSPQRCDWCRRYNDGDQHNCAGCGAPVMPAKFIDVTTICSTDRDVIAT